MAAAKAVGRVLSTRWDIQLASSRVIICAGTLAVFRLLVCLRPVAFCFVQVWSLFKFIEISMRQRASKRTEFRGVTIKFDELAPRERRMWIWSTWKNFKCCLHKKMIDLADQNNYSSIVMQIKN
jgi:hypothetical protein